MDLPSLPSLSSLLSSSSGINWRDNLYDASFRGVPFSVESDEGSFGRRVQVHEYPNRDKPYTEDLGRATRRLTINAYLVGADGVLDGLAPSLVRVHQRADELVIEIDPGQSTELIERYEELYGLPDSCSPVGTQTLRQRQQRLEAKANVAGGINEQFFLDQLEALGYTGVTIEQFQHLDASPDPEWGDRWRYFWRVTLPVDAGAQWQTCTDACNTPIRTWGDTVAECVINKLCPSHTVVLFSYPDEDEDAQD
ncbi:DUF2313 domain-containing protein [Escherichia coli]|nr:DUF2313 domain-containing protein [Escherichia coli]